MKIKITNTVKISKVEPVLRKLLEVAKNYYYYYLNYKKHIILGPTLETPLSLKHRRFSRCRFYVALVLSNLNKFY